MIHNARRRAACLALLAALAGVSACTDAENPTALAATPETAHTAANASAIVHEPRNLAAFDVALSASGSMQPGKPIEVHVRVKANLPVDDAEVVISTPDMDRPALSTWDPRFSPEVGKKVQVRARKRAGWGRGQSNQETVRLTVPHPGYYRVTATVFSRSELPAFLDDSTRVVPNVHREIWLRVDKRGGRYTAQFDTLVFPAGAERRAGPLHCTVDLDEERRGKKRDAGCDGALITEFDSDTMITRAPLAAATFNITQPGDEIICPMSATSLCGEDPCLMYPESCLPTEPYVPPVPVDPCYARTHLCIQFVYVDAKTGSYRNAPEGTLVEGSYQDRDCFVTCWWEEERSTFFRADAQGRVIIPCPSSSTEKRLRTAYEFLDEYTAVSRSEWDGPTVHGTCPTGWRTVDMVPNQEAYVYGNVRKSAQRAAGLFARNTSERTRVDFDSGDLRLGNSWYNLALNVISIDIEDIWFDEGAATQAHEYGHAYHNKALGGIAHIYVTGDPRHNFTDDSNGAKALLEGFATFFETLVMPGKDYSTHYYVRWPQLWSSLPTGPRAESRAAAFLWDVIDDASEKGSPNESPSSTNYWGTVSGGPYEDFDAIQVSHYGLGTVIRSCGGFIPATSIEGLHTCLQTYVGTASQPAMVRLYERTVYNR
jgi:hypothetical protein